MIYFKVLGYALIVAIAVLLKPLIGRRKKGCLHDKTPEQKAEFFHSLYDLYQGPAPSREFFWQQFHRLKPLEKEELFTWACRQRNKFFAQALKPHLSEKTRRNFHHHLKQ
jgi:hypothetical protein